MGFLIFYRCKSKATMHFLISSLLSFSNLESFRWLIVSFNWLVFLYAEIYVLKKAMILSL